MTKSESIENEIIELECRFKPLDAKVKLQEAELNGLREQVQKHETELKALRGEVQRTEIELKRIRQERGNLQSQIESKRSALKRERHNAKKPLGVSDHAIVRYLERKLGLNLDDIRQEIVTSELETKVKTFGDGKYGGVVVKDNVIVTVV